MTPPDAVPPPQDYETAAHDGHKTELRLWLRLLTCTTLIESTVRQRLRTRFDVTLPRFDLMAQLDRHPQGLTMGELSRRMMVSAGNVTGLADRMEREGLVARSPHPGDRRTLLIRLTDAGRAAFAEMARAHEDWIAELLSDLAPADLDRMMDLLARTKASVHAHGDPAHGDPGEAKPARRGG